MQFGKFILFSAGALAIMAQTGAEARTTLTSKSCEQAQAYIKQRGADIINNGTHTFRRVVANRSYCSHSERIRPFYGKTADNAKCHIGFECHAPVLRPEP